MTRWISRSLMGLSLAGLWGCGAEPDTHGAGADDWATTQEMTLLGKIDFDGGSTLEFYEAFDGALVLSGAGPITTPPPSLDRSLKPVEIFRSLAPGQAVPTALLEAQARADELAEAGPVVRRPGAAAQAKAAEGNEPEVGKVSSAVWGDNDSACPWSWFSSVKCQGAQTCLGFVDGAKSIEHDDVMYSIGMTCNYKNGHNHLSQYRTWWSWTAQGTWFVPPGSYRYAEWWNATLDFDSRVVVQANGLVPGSHLAMRSSDSPWRVGTP